MDDCESTKIHVWINMSERILNMTDKPDSVTIKESAKGDLYFEVKCYGDVDVSVGKLVEKARETYQELVKMRN